MNTYAFTRRLSDDFENICSEKGQAASRQIKIQRRLSGTFSDHPEGLLQSIGRGGRRITQFHRMVIRLKEAMRTFPVAG